MASDKPPELLGYGKGDHEVMSGELSLHLFYQPLMGFMVLAVGTMPVPAGSIHDVVLTAFFTLIDHYSAVLGTAVNDGVDDFSVFKRHGLTEGVDILSGICLEDLVNGHGHLLSSVS